MDERERFYIRRKVLAENGMDFEDYIAKQQAEIDELVEMIADMNCSCVPYADRTGEGVCDRCRILASHKGE